MLLSRLIKFVKYKIWGSYKTTGICNFLHWIRCHTYNRYHIVNIKGEDNYNWGWIDADNKLYLACFSILREFVEKEDPKVGLRTLKDYEPEEGFHSDDRKFVEKQLESDNEIRLLYNWWTIDRAKEHADLDRFFNSIEDLGMNFESIPNSTNSKVVFGKGFKSQKYDEYKYRAKKLEEKDEEMLLRLMKIRHRLWT